MADPILAAITKKPAAMGSDAHSGMSQQDALKGGSVKVNPNFNLKSMFEGND